MEKLERTLNLFVIGPDVLSLTQKLRELDLMTYDTDVFNQDVERAVRAFQSKGLSRSGRPLKVDGVVGPVTWWSLFSDDYADTFVPVPANLEWGHELPKPGEPGYNVMVAALHVGLEELRDGAKEEGGNNKGVHVAKYHGVDPEVLTTRWAWCAAFVSWCVDQACSRDSDLTKPFRKSGSARNIMKQTKKSDLWDFHGEDDYEPQVGDLAFWWRESPQSWKGHIGIVMACDNGIVYILEGNRGRYPAMVSIYDYVLEDMKKILGFSHLKETT